MFPDEEQNVNFDLGFFCYEPTGTVYLQPSCSWNVLINCCMNSARMDPYKIALVYIIQASIWGIS